MSATRIIDGRIERGRSQWHDVVRSSFEDLSWQRVLFLMVVAGTFIFTNPANYPLGKFLQVTHPMVVGPRTTSWWAKSFSSLLFREKESSRMVTNYLFFSVQETHHALVFMFLQDSWACRYDDIEVGFLCDFLTPQLSHGKPVLVRWDGEGIMDPVHTAHRSICWALMLSAAISFCFTTNRSSSSLSEGGRLWNNPFLDIVCSIFYRPHLLYDLLHANVVVYPALLEMHRILPQLRTGAFFSTGRSDVDYALSVILLVVVIGGGANYISSVLILGNKDKLYGFSSVVAASMAYTQRISLMGAPLLLRLGDIRLTTTDLYWAELGMLLLKANRRSLSTMTAWIVAGILGSALAKYHLENLAGLGGLYKFFGLA